MIVNIFKGSSLHSFIPDIYIAPLQETYSEALSVQLRQKRNGFVRMTTVVRMVWNGVDFSLSVQKPP